MPAATIIDFAAERTARGVRPSRPRFHNGDPVWIFPTVGTDMVPGTVYGHDHIANRYHVIPHSGPSGGRYVAARDVMPRRVRWTDPSFSADHPEGAA